MPIPFVVMPGRAPRPLNAVGEKITVLASGRLERVGARGCRRFRCLPMCTMSG
jgi:hypothetical protein